MGNCRHCKKSAGWLRSVHKECAVKFEHGTKLIASLVADAIQHEESLTSFYDQAREVAKEHFLAEQDIEGLVVKGFGHAVDAALDDHLLSEAEEEHLGRTLQALELPHDKVAADGTLEKIRKGRVLRELVNGRLPDTIDYQGRLPFNFQKGERLVWHFEAVQYYEMKTKREFVGRSQGVSVRLARGVYYRTGSFRGNPVETTSFEHVDTGVFAFTNKHLYFSGAKKSFRIAYAKIVSFTPYSDGIGLHRDAASAKPQLFVTVDGWFTYNLAVNLSELGAEISSALPVASNKLRPSR